MILSSIYKKWLFLWLNQIEGHQSTKVHNAAGFHAWLPNFQRAITQRRRFLYIWYTLKEKRNATKLNWDISINSDFFFAECIYNIFTGSLGIAFSEIIQVWPLPVYHWTCLSFHLFCPKAQPCPTHMPKLKVYFQSLP